MGGREFGGDTIQPRRGQEGSCGPGTAGQAQRPEERLRPAHQPPSFPRLAGALDVSSCPQNRKNVLYAKAREAFGSARTTAAYYRFMRPYLGEPPPCMGHAP